MISTAVEYALKDFGEGGSASALRILRFGRVARTFKVGAHAYGHAQTAVCVNACAHARAYTQHM